MAAPGFSGTASTAPVGCQHAAERLTRHDALSRHLARPAGRRIASWRPTVGCRQRAASRQIRRHAPRSQRPSSSGAGAAFVNQDIGLCRRRCRRGRHRREPADPGLLDGMRPMHPGTAVAFISAAAEAASGRPAPAGRTGGRPPPRRLASWTAGAVEGLLAVMLAPRRAPQVVGPLLVASPAYAVIGDERRKLDLLDARSAQSCAAEAQVPAHPSRRLLGNKANFHLAVTGPSGAPSLTSTEGDGVMSGQPCRP